MDNIKEALDNGWNDRIFLHYKELVDPNAIRPQDETGEEWKQIVLKLTDLTAPNPIPTPKFTATHPSSPSFKKD